jgi:hypothetical protein
MASSPSVPVGCERCGIEIGGTGEPRCSGRVEKARQDLSWPYFPKEPGGSCQLCGEGSDAHRGLRTLVTSGLYCNAHDKKMNLCCNCGKHQGVPYFFETHSCDACKARRLDLITLSTPEAAAEAERHLVVLCHGLYGLPSELYAARDRLRAVPGCLVHCCESYAGSGTMQGIDEIGELIAQEVQQVIMASHARYPQTTCHPLTTISFMGHSLGGVIARSAISKLYNGSDHTIAGLKPRLFVTTASPHLGVSNYGPLPQLPTALTAPLANIFAGKTGKDLFSIHSSEGQVRRLATDEANLNALRAFAVR